MSNVEKFQLFKYPWDTKRGLLYYSLYLFIGFIFVASFFEKYKIIKVKGLLYYFGFLYLLYLIIWLIKRARYNFLTNKLFVFFAVKIDEENKKITESYNELIYSFKEKLKDYGLSNNIKVMRKPMDINFSDHSAAEAKTKLNQVGATLIISGVPITTKKEIEYKFNYHYEFVYPSRYHADEHQKEAEKKHYRSIMDKLISKSISFRKWSETEKINEKKILHGNMFEVSTYILALCMYTRREYDKTIELLQPTIDECNKNPHKFGPLIKEIKEILLHIYLNKFDDIKWKFDKEEMSSLAKRMYKLDKYDYGALIVMALVSELDGDREGAKEFTQKAEMNSPKNIYAHKINSIYFSLSEKDYNEAIEILDDIKNNCDFKNVNFTISFLEKKYEETKDMACMFNLGAIRIIWSDKEVGKDELENFIKKTENNVEYDLLIKYAKDLITTHS